MKSLKKMLVGMFSVALFAALVVAPAAFADEVGKPTADTATPSTTADATSTTGTTSTDTTATVDTAHSGTYVFDDQGVLTDSEFATLEQMGADYASKYGIGVYIQFTDMMNGDMNPTSSERNEYGRQVFLQKGLGVGPNKNGIIVVVAVKSRDYVTVKHFADSSEDPFSDSAVDKLEGKYTEELSDNDWYEAAFEYYTIVGEQMEYFATTGKQWTEPDFIGLILKILAMLGIPAVVAFSSIKGDKAAMKTAHEKSEASNYLDQSSLNLSVSNDQFINTTLAVVPIPEKDDSDSGGGWSDMGGGFSGSGGGKF